MKCPLCHSVRTVHEVANVPMSRRAIGGRTKPYVYTICYQCAWNIVRGCDAQIGSSFADEVTRILQEHRVGREQGSRKLTRWLETRPGVFAPEDV